MDATFIAFFALLGLAVGSFLNLSIDRLPQGHSLTKPPSHCPHCDHRLSPLDLVPLFSYIWLRGKCRYCRAPIPLRLPLVEAATAILFALVAYRFGLHPVSGILAAFVSLFIVIFFIDLEEGLILNKVVLPSLPLALALYPLGPGGMELSVGEALLRSAAGGALGFAVMLLIYLASRGGMGAGDVKLGGLIGLVAGFPQVVVALLLAFISGGLIAIILLVLKLRGRKEAIPFGPFFAGAVVFVLLVGPDIADWYLGLSA